MTKVTHALFKERSCYCTHSNNNVSEIGSEGEIKMKRREDIVLRIEKLKTNPIDNAKLIRKWERILRNFDRLDNSNT